VDVLKDLAYFFEFDHELQGTVADYTRDTVSEIVAWQSMDRPGSLTYTIRDADLVLVDTRSSVDATEIVLEEPLSTICSYCDEAQTTGNIQQHLASSRQNLQMTPQEVREALLHGSSEIDGL
jgi:hypothetical protein